MGLTFQQIQKYERGVNQLAASRVFQFARVLNVPVTFFFEGMPGEARGRARSLAEPAQVAFRHEDVTRRETLELVRAYYAIDDPELRKKLRDLVEKIGAAGPDGPSDPNNPGDPSNQDGGAA